MKYFSYISGWYVPKNKLEEVVHQFLRSAERQIIDETDLKKFQNFISNQIADLNKKYPRCRPIVVRWKTETKAANARYHYPDILIDLNNFSICHFKLFISREEEEKP